MSLRRISLVLAAALAGGCSVPDYTFTGSTKDGGADTSVDSTTLDAATDSGGGTDAVTETGDDALADGEASVADPRCNSLNLAPVESFSDSMVGCPAANTYDKRGELCGAGYIVCSAKSWVAQHGVKAPTYTYWVDEQLGFAGTATGSCWTGPGSCPAGGAMKVCPTTAPDPLGVTCTWNSCGYTAATPVEYFGGCSDKTEQAVGTLCCKAPCATALADQDFDGVMFGCPGKVAYADRATVCGAGYHVCTALEYRTRQNGLVPDHDYWVSEPLHYTAGSTSTSCAATLPSTGVSGDCGPTQPMRVCRPTGADIDGNTCGWSNCGFDSPTPNLNFGGCAGSTATAGVLCCAG
jgi:hypothetical protein